MNDNSEKPDAYWQSTLSPEVYRIARQKGTEAPFSGKYTYELASGMYHCACCNAPLFQSETKYDSGSGWPSFFQPVAPNAVKEHRDISHGMTRIEITCATCHAHLGHVFPDGPAPTGQRYCINSLSLDLKKNSESSR